MQVLAFGHPSTPPLDHRRNRIVLMLQRAAYTRSVGIPSRASGRRALRRGTTAPLTGATALPAPPRSRPVCSPVHSAVTQYSGTAQVGWRDC